MSKLLIAIDSLAHAMGIVACGLANSLADRYDVHILTAQRGCFTTSKRVSVHLIPRYPLMTIAYSTIVRPIVSKVISQVLPDIIHSHIVLPWGYIFRSDERTKTVITVSGSDVWPRKGYPRKFFLDRAFQHSTVISNSRWLSSYMEENYRVRPVVIPTGVDTRIFRPLGDSARRKVVLYVGRFIEKKGILELVRAARALPEYEFWLAGNGPLEIPAVPNVKILGFHSNVVPLYSSATLCAFPSHCENFPNTGLEAMACGRAVVATERGFSEYVENGKDGILVKPHDVQSLVDSIRYLMENEKARKRLERNARKKATQYDWTVIAKRYETLYESL